MNADVFFKIGSTHKICQDYGLANADPEKPYIIISDGCSSAPDVDFGARILARCMAEKIYDNLFGVFNPIVETAWQHAETLGLSQESLCATLLMARVVEGHFMTYAIGDGVIAARKKNGQFVAYEYEFTSGAPFYLRYLLSDETLIQYFSKFGNEVIRRTYTNDKITEEKLAYVAPFFHVFPLEEYDFVALFSDGIKSFQKLSASTTSKEKVSIPVIEILEEFLAFKGFNGEFVQRRCQRAFSKFNDHYDDMTLAVLSQQGS